MSITNTNSSSASEVYEAKIQFKTVNGIVMSAKPCERVPCPKCGAKPGDPCLLLTGQRANFCHKQRISAAKKLLGQNANQTPLPGTGENENHQPI